MEPTQGTMARTLEVFVPVCTVPSADSIYVPSIISSPAAVAPLVFGFAVNENSGYTGMLYSSGSFLTQKSINLNE
jgi:hypothetical protein